MNEKMVLDNLPLVLLVIKRMDLHFKNEDEFQECYDAGLEGLINGVKAYNSNYSKPSTFLYKCIKNMIIRHIYLSGLEKRKVNYINKLSLDEELESGLYIEELIADDRINIEEKIEKKLKSEKLLEIINQIKSPKQRVVLKMYYGLGGFQEHKTSLIAKNFKITEQAVKAILIRARRTLKKELEKRNIHSESQI